ncbi:MAG TPA: HIT family protein [Candidatus Paceibacterota bacterium]|nr:HIT family protein [Candidatus Paceibacterota bacterium]
MNDIFDKILRKEIPAQFVYEDDVCVVVMDKYPVVPGQVLVIPRDCIDYFFEMDDVKYHHCLSIAKRMAAALDVTYETERTCMIIEGFEVPHAHLKLYPVTRREFTPHGGKEVDDATLEKEAEKIKANLR